MTSSRARLVSLSLVATIALTVATYTFAQSAAVQNDNQYLSSSETVATYSSNDFALDGDLSKAAWKQAKWVEFDHDPTGKTENPMIKTRVAAVWTDRYIYFAFSGHYESINVYEGEDISKERWELWNRDVVGEVFLNPRPDRVTHYYEFEVAPNNQWIDLEIEKNEDTV